MFNLTRLQKQHWHSGLEVELLSRLRDGTADRAIVFDVGANDGSYSVAWSPGMLPGVTVGSVSAVMLEPQERFHEKLMRHARRNNFTFLPVAAARTDGFQTFVAYGARSDSRSSALEASSVLKRSDPGASMIRSRVKTRDLVNVIAPRLPAIDSVDAGRTLSLLKLDVEGEEFNLIPWLLTRGILCRLSYLVIEWHLNRVPPPKRLAALGVRLSFNSLLQIGCDHPPIAVHHDDFQANNLAVPVPGIQRVAMEHSSWAGKTKGGIDISQGTTFYENADWAYFSRAKRLSCGAPRCAGSCDYERLACDFEASRASYVSMVAAKVPVVRAGLFPMHSGMKHNVSNASKFASFNSTVESTMREVKVGGGTSTRSTVGTSTTAGNRSETPQPSPEDEFRDKFRVTACECVRYPARPHHTLLDLDYSAVSVAAAQQ